MIQLFVGAQDSKGKQIVADHFEFESVPRLGEEVVVDQDGKQFLLLVKGATNFASTKGDFMNEVSRVHLACDLIKELDLRK